MRYTINFITLFILALGSISPLKANALQPGQDAPIFKLPDQKGHLIDLNSFRGKVVYVDFWASWCGPCKRSLPWMSQLKQQFDSNKFEILAVNLDSSREDAERMLGNTSSNLTVLFDPAGGVPERYGLTTMPTSFLLDKNGKVTAVFEGFDDDHREKIEDQIRSQFK